MTNPLPPQIASYFLAKDSGDAASLDLCLAPDVIVRDPGENTEVRGRAEVKAWILQTHKKFTLSTKITDSRLDADVITVDTLVSGDFPGSPLPFAYRFSLEKGKITSIDIAQTE